LTEIIEVHGKYEDEIILEYSSKHTTFAGFQNKCEIKDVSM
jgi:hypothetical protein